MATTSWHATAGRIALAALALLLWAGALAAHEARPSEAMLTMEDGTARLDLRLNAEALLAGIDLDGVADTDETPGSDAYDRLRLLPPEEIAARLRAAWPGIGPGMALRSDIGAPVLLGLRSIEASEVGDATLMRPTRVLLEGALPDGTGAVTFHWGAGQGVVVLRQVGVEGGYSGILAGVAVSPPMAVSGGARQGWFEVFASYIPVGFDHILPKGLDHILFVLGLFFLSPRMKPLLFQITAFTAAHTVTLALGALGIVTIPAEIVEPLIAASIVFVAVENLVSYHLSPWRPVVVFGFGLLHGLGFASVLGDFGLPEGQFVPALLGFNVGVELGQLTVVALAFLAVGWFSEKPWYRSRIAMPASVVIGAVGAWWVVERTLL